MATGTSYNPKTKDDDKRKDESQSQQHRDQGQNKDQGQNQHKDQGQIKEGLDKVKEVGASAIDKAKDAAHSVGEMASQAATAVGKKADEYAGIAGTDIKRFGDNLRERAPHDGMLGQASQAMADTIKGGGRYLEEAKLSGMADDVTHLIKQHPMPTVLLCLGIGFILGRAFKD